MDLVLDLLSTVSRWSRSNLSEISLALVGCLLVLFGTDIKGWVEQRLGGLAGALRVPFMALLVLIGSGAALIYATPWVIKGLSQFNNYALAPVLLVVLVLIGVVADRQPRRAGHFPRVRPLLGRAPRRSEGATFLRRLRHAFAALARPRAGADFAGTLHSGGGVQRTHSHAG